MHWGRSPRYVLAGHVPAGACTRQISTPITGVKIEEKKCEPTSDCISPKPERIPCTPSLKRSFLSVWILLACFSLPLGSGPASMLLFANWIERFHDKVSCVNSTTGRSPGGALLVVFGTLGAYWAGYPISLRMLCTSLLIRECKFVVLYHGTHWGKPPNVELNFGNLA